MVAAFAGTVTAYSGNITVTGTATALQIEALAASTTGTLSATLAAGQTTLDLSSSTASVNAIILNDNGVNVTGSAQSDQITVGRGADTLNLGGGADTVTIAGEENADGDSINTGSGDDAINISGDNTVRSTESITIVGGDGTDTLTVSDTNDFTGSPAFSGVEIVINSDVTFSVDQVVAANGAIRAVGDGSHAVTLKAVAGGATSVELTGLQGVTSVSVAAGVEAEITDNAASQLAATALAKKDDANVTVGLTLDPAATVVVSTTAKDTLTTAAGAGVTPLIAEADLKYVIKDTAAKIATALSIDADYITDSSGNITILNDSSATDASAMKTVLDAMPGGKTADATAVSSISGSLADIAAIVDHKTIDADTTLASDVDLSFNSVPAMPAPAAVVGDITDLNKALAVTTGSVTGSIMGAAGTLATITSEAASSATNSLTLNVSDPVAEDITAASLSTISAATSGTVTVINAIDVKGDISAVKVLQALSNVTLPSDYTVNLTDAGAVTVTDLSSIAGKTAGNVVVAGAITTSGTAAEVTAAFASGVAGTHVVVGGSASVDDEFA